MLKLAPWSMTRYMQGLLVLTHLLHNNLSAVKAVWWSEVGEMEVWALKHGASHTLQELLTIKSDDMLGRALYL